MNLARKKAQGRETKESILFNEKFAKYKRYKVKEGIKLADILKKTAESEAEALEQRRMGGEIDPKLMNEIRVLNSLSGKPMNVRLMTRAEIQKELANRNISKQRREVLEKTEEAREA